MMRIIGTFVTLVLILHPVFGLYLNLTLLDFLYYNQSNTWKEAQSLCREKHIDLITIRSEEEDRVFPDVIAWIGLYRENIRFPWKWSRGDEMASFLNWNPGGKRHICN
ncbi:hypothetical protein GOODEAATRI_031238 [Goodea atripinnis]|uniref:C-type lectin domain-containing protein n=1 Tax=Goodea atripinnis TaxID=208336 RepID=A0ABV0Q2L2_9TELE